jgi:hypothetical protein
MRRVAKIPPDLLYHTRVGSNAFDFTASNHQNATPETVCGGSQVLGSACQL